MPPGFQEWAESVSLWQIVGWSTGVVAAWLFVWKVKPWSRLKRFATAILNLANIVDSVQELPAFIKRTDATLKQQNKQIGDIHHEVHFNNGSSVKDAVIRVEAGVAGLYDKVDELTAEDESIRKDMGYRPDRPDGGEPKRI